MFVLKFVLEPFARKQEKLERQLQVKMQQVVSTKTSEPTSVEQNKHKSESILDKLAMEKKEQTEIDYEKEDEIFKRIEQANRRQAFRVLLANVACEYTLHPNGTKEKGTIIDLSTSGMRLHTPYNFAFQSDLYLTVAFEFNEKIYELKGIPLRKNKISAYRYEYGIVFQHEERKQREELFRALWEEQRKRNRQII